MLPEKDQKEEDWDKLIMCRPGYVSITVKTVRAPTYLQQSVFGGFDCPVKFNRMNQLKFLAANMTTL